MSDDPRAITIAALRSNWQKQVADYGNMIAWIEGGGTIRVSGQSAQQATKALLESVVLLRGELEHLLQKFKE